MRVVRAWVGGGLGEKAVTAWRWIISITCLILALAALKVSERMDRLEGRITVLERQRGSK